MAWTAQPATWASIPIPGVSDFNALIRDDMNYLLNRPATAIKRDGNADYTTTSTTFVDIDGTNLAITLTGSGSAILMGFSGVVLTGGLDADFPQFDFLVDGTRYSSAGADGLAAALNLAAHKSFVSFIGMATGLTAGAHVIKVQWKSASGVSVKLYSGAGVAGTDYIPTLVAAEIG